MKVTTHRGLRVFDSDLERQVVDEVLDGQSYQPPPLKAGVEVRTIADIGAHVGAAAVYFRKLWPDAAITCYEPAPDLFELLKQNMPANCEAYQAALSDRRGKLPLTVSGRQVCNSLYGSPPGLTTHAHEIEVEVYNARDALDLIDNQPIDVIKLDAEGAEVPILKSALGYFQRAKVVYVEFHRYDDRPLLDALHATHVLFHARIDYSPNRGELAYVHKDAIEPRLLKRLYLPR